MELIPVSFLQGVTARSIELNNTPADRTQFLESEREMHPQGIFYMHFLQKSVNMFPVHPFKVKSFFYL